MGFLKNLCLLVLWTKAASALEGLGHQKQKASTSGPTSPTVVQVSRQNHLGITKHCHPENPIHHIPPCMSISSQIDYGPEPATFPSSWLSDWARSTDGQTDKGRSISPTILATSHGPGVHRVGTFPN